MPSLRNLRTLRSLRHRNFRLLLEGALISSSGDFMQNVAQSWLVWHVSKSPVAIGVVAFFDTAPRLLVGALGGAIADRFDRRRVLMITQTAAMIQAFIYWLAVQFEVIQLWHIALLAFFLGVVNTINQTARQSLVNSLVPKDELLNAIGLQSSVFNFSKTLGPSLGGVLIEGPGWRAITTAPPDAVATGMQITFAVAAALMMGALAIVAAARARVARRQDSRVER